MPSFEAAQSIRRIHEATSGDTGEAFFRSLSRSVAQVLGTRFAFVGEVIPGAERVRVLAVWDGREFASPFEYDLANTPCAGVVAGECCQYPDNVQQRFPADTMLVDMGIQAYFGVPIRGRQGRPRAILAALHDAPSPCVGDLEDMLAMFAVRAAVELDRRDAEEALRNSERRYREIVTTCSEGVWTIDARGETNFVNAQMAGMLGYEAEAMLGRTMFDFMDDAGKAQAAKNLERRKQGLRDLHRFELLHRSGRTVHTWMNTSPLMSADGTFAGALAMVTDVTEQVALEERMREAHKLESLGLLAGGIAHDFNNLLVGVLGRADLALARLEPSHPVRPLVDGVREAAERAAALTRQLLAYAGKAPVSMRPINLPRAVREIAGLCRSSAPSNVSIELDCAEPDLTVSADPGALTQVILNLVTNAVQALGARGGHVRLSTRCEPLSSFIPGPRADPLPCGDYAVLRVEDDGVGMDAATCERAFDPFYTTKEHGRGLGLAAVRGIVRAHRGAISVSSVPTKGTTFLVYLPTTAAVDASHVQAPTVSVAPPTGRVLVADDEPVVLDMVRIALEELNYEVDTCSDAQAALARFGEAPERYVTVLLDVTMPGGGGLAAARLMLAQRPTVPVIMMSGYTEEDLPPELRLRFIQKPFRLSTLVEAVQGTRAVTAPS